jgi:two-component system KDP operon response regulator KdpE
MKQKKPFILIIEDEPSIRKLLTISLESAGYRVSECVNGRDGIRAVSSLMPDLIILDLGLPDIDGKNVIAEVRELSYIPIIVCSARINDDEIIKVLKAGADDYIPKPFNPNVLLARIQANLRNTSAQKSRISEITNGAIKMDIVRHEVF